MYDVQEDHIVIWYLVSFANKAPWREHNLFYRYKSCESSRLTLNVLDFMTSKPVQGFISRVYKRDGIKIFFTIIDKKY